MARIRTYIADAHPLYRDGLLAVFATDPEITTIGTGQSGPQAIADIMALEPDVAVIDAFLPERTGIEVVAALKAGGSPVCTLMLTASDEDEVVYGALVQGANGYLLKLATGDKICAAVKRVSRGGRVVDPAVAGMIASRIESSENPLTRRELEILNLVAGDHTVDEIAERLHLRATTVNEHIRRTYPKLGVTTRTGAIAEAMRRRLIR